MNTLSFDQTLQTRGYNPWIGRSLLVVMALVLAGGVWFASTQQETRTREAADISTMIPFEPPPPPPPEPEPQPREQVQAETPTPQASQAPADAGDNALSMDADAQAGFGGIQVGDGGGSRGAGRAGAGSYASYLQGVIQRAVQNDRRLRNQRLRLPVSIWVDASGRITRFEVRGEASPHEAALRAAILAVAEMRAPPAGILDRLPVNMTVDLRPGG